MSRLHAAILAVSTLGLALGACAAPPPVRDLVVGATVLGGDLNVASFQVRPGTTATRVATALIDLAMSSDKPITREDLVPGAGSSS